jgi:SPP1 gp7 family putative phage head morphogenesis protein
MDAVQRQYRARIAPLLSLLVDVVGNTIAPAVYRATQRGDADPVSAAFDAAKKRVAEKYTRDSVDALVRPVAKATSTQQRRGLARQLGAEIAKGIKDKFLPRVVEAFARENVALITSLPTEFFARTEKMVAKGLGDGVRAEELSQQLQDELGVVASRADLIARDQISKLAGDLNRERQTELGIEEFVWRTVGDERVRSEHADYNGQTYSWAALPPDGAPGEAINCRCYADPVIT